MSGVTELATTQASESGERGYSLSSIIEHPGWFLNLLIATLFEWSDIYLFSMLGNALGSFQDELRLTVALLLPFVLILGLGAIRQEKECIPRMSLRAAMIAFFLSVMALVILTMFLAFTRVGFTLIEGVQGRYFLPVLPLLLFGLQGKAILAQKDYTYPLVYSEALMSAFIVCINISIAITL